MFQWYSYTIIRERITSYALPNSVYCRTVQHTDTNMDLIYAATPPPY